MADLAKKVGVTPGFISQIERDLSNPSIDSIQKIAKALGASVSSFFEEMGPRNGRVVRRAERRQVVFPRAGVTDYLLSPSLSGFLQVIHTEVAPRGGSGPEPYRHDSDEECAVVLKGRMRFWVGDEEDTLEAGDSITFESRIPHRWENIGRGKLQVLWVMTPPSY